MVPAKSVEIDRFRQTIEQKFDIRAISRSLAVRDVDLRAKEATLASIVGTFLRPVNLSAVGIDSDPDAPFRLISTRPRVAFACVDQGFDFRTIKVRAHHAHSLAIAPVKFAALLFEMELLWRECLAFANDGYAILTAEIGALDRTVVLVRNAHVSPVNVTGVTIDNDPVGNSTASDNDFSVRPVGVSRMNPAAASFQEKQAPGCRGRRCAVWFGNFGNTFHALISYFFLKLSQDDILETLSFSPPVSYWQRHGSRA